MIGQTNEVLNTANVIITGAVTIIVTWLTVQRSRDKKEADQRHKTASQEREVVAEKAEAAATKTEEVLTAVKPTNGYDTLGQALQALEDRVNEMGERLARGDHRFDNMERNEQRIAEQLAIVSEANTQLIDKLSEVLALQGELRRDTRILTDSVVGHHHAWDDPASDGSPSLLEWAKQGRMRDEKRKKGRA